jgi:hypothetical protein
MKNIRKVSRRSFMTRVIGGAVVGGGAMVALGSQAEAFQINDSDPSDPANRTGLTDRDSGDRAGNGRGATTRYRACSDNDSGSNADAAGRGRGNGRSDSDSGSNADRPGCGRR